MLKLNKEELKSRLKEQGYKSIDELCESCELCPETFKRAKARDRLTVMQLYKISKALNCHMEDLLFFSKR